MKNFSIFFCIFAKSRECFFLIKGNDSFSTIKNIETCCTPSIYKTTKNSVSLLLPFIDFHYYGFVGHYLGTSFMRWYQSQFVSKFVFKKHCKIFHFNFINRSFSKGK
jgi:hypothetical protein